MTVPQTITSEVQKLEPSAVIELFELDLTALGDSVYRFHAGTNEVTQPIVWQGYTYVPFPVKVTGFDTNGRGQLPRPRIAVSNVTGAITGLVLQFQDMVTAKVVRKRTLAKYLDAVNFSSGTNPTADPTAEFPSDIYFIDRKSVETKDIVEFELTAAFDLYGVQLPRRQIIQNVCVWQYRSSECGYAGTAYFDANDQPVGARANDVCGKRLSSCKCRFGAYAELPFGSFPAAGLIK